LMAETTIFKGGKSKDEDDYSLSRWCIAWKEELLRNGNMDELKNELRCVEEKWSVIEYMPLVMALCVTENEIGIGCDACTGEGVMYLCCILEICDVNSVRLIYHALYSLHTYGYSCDICSVR
jgi:hypothetical protein